MGSVSGVQGQLQVSMLKAAQQQKAVEAQTVSAALESARQIQAASLRPGTGLMVDIRA